MNGSEASCPDLTHHRLLEGVLLRLARSPEPGRLILRGGMLLRHWFRPLARFAADLDLVAAGTFDVKTTARAFAALLADRGVDDGVTFDRERFRAEGIWLNTDYPGVRVHAVGEVDGTESEFSADVTFGEPLVPAPAAGDYPTLRGGPARVWMCRPETITGRKLHALHHMGMQHWRPKDLNDLRLLLTRVPLDFAELPAAITTSFTSRGNTPAEARALFGPEAWWGMKTSAARWRDFVQESAGLAVPRDLARVVAEVAERLNPVLERLP